MRKILKKNIRYLLLFLIVSLAILLRFYQLGQNPPSLDWDEASLGYNAYSILKTGADEYDNKFPLSIRSFDDYKPPVYVYLAVPSIAIFGLTEFAIRLPSALLGTIAVFTTYFFVKEVFRSRKEGESIALLSSFFMAISPWHLQFSRAAFEGNVGLTFFLLGMYLFLKGLRDGRLLLISGIFCVVSMYSYHSFRLVVPLVFLASIVIFYNTLWKKRTIALITFLVMLFLSMPIFISIFSASGTGARLSMVTIFAPSQTLASSIKRLEYDHSKGDVLGILFDNRRIVYFLAVVKGYLDHFNPDFLFLHGDGGRQHHAVDMGMLYLFELPFIVAGFVLLWQKIDKQILFLFIYFLLSPIASAISTGTPHPVRAIAMIPALHIFTSVGVVNIVSHIKYQISSKQIQYSIFTLFFVCIIFNILHYLHQYYVHTPIEYGDFWQYGYKQVFENLSTKENKAQRIIVTYHYDQPYIYYLLYRKIDPVWYQKNWDYQHNGQTERFRRVIGKYEFRNIDYQKDENLKNAVLVGTPDEIPGNAHGLFKEIHFPNGDIAFRLVEQ